MKVNKESDLVSTGASQVTADEVIALLPVGSSFGGVTREEFSDLLSVGRLRKVRPGEQLLAQGETGDALFLIISGTVRLSLIAANGQMIVLEYVEAGSMIGEVGTFDGGQRSASAHAVQHGMALRLPKAAMVGYINRHPGFALCLLAELSLRLRMANDTIESDRAYGAGARIARHLNRLSDLKADGRHLASELSQAELGHFVGISRENVNRQLSIWAEIGIIQLENGKVSVLDGPRLRQIAAPRG
jgi:CRP/FNR family cyclic AMP-dependent transcriptional regulator